jgi:streptogramin lyase
MRMPLITRSVVSVTLLGSLALGACSSNDSLGKNMQPVGGQGGGEAGSPGTGGGQAGAGGQAPVGADGSIPVPVKTQQVVYAAIGSVTYFTVDLSFTGDLSDQAQAVAIAPDGAPWFTASGLLLRVASDDTVRAWSQPPPGGYSTSLVSDGTGKLWMTFWGSLQAVGGFDTVTHAVATLPMPDALARPTALASDGQGGVWVSGGNEPIVGRLDGMNGVAVVAMESAPSPITLSTAGLAVASDGQIFVSDYDQGRIGRVVNGAFVWTDLGGTANAPSGLAADVDGSVWFVSLGKPNVIGRVAHDGTLATYPVSAPTAPISDKVLSTIARAQDGSLWFALPEQQALARAGADGQMTWFVALGSGSYPVGLAFDPSGRLWFTNNTGFGRLDLTNP